MNGSQHGPMRLFYIEDDDNDAFLFSRAVAKSGRSCVVTRFPDALKAIEALERITHPESESPHLIITDLKMTRMGGLEFLRWMHQSRFCCVPVVLLSASSLPKDVIKAYHHGVRSYIAKPVDFASLQETINNLITYWLDACRVMEHAPLLCHPELAGIDIIEEMAHADAPSI